MRRIPILCLFASGLAFLAFRFYAHSRIVGAGFVDTGLLQYDSYYHLSFAHELARENSWLWFRNPFGSEGDLVNPLASLLRVLRPLWNDHLLLFGFLWGTLFAALGGYAFGRVAEAAARGSEKRTLTLALWAILGGGIGYFFAFDATPMTSLNVGTWWGLTWTANSFAAWELLYHAVFWAGLAAWLRRRHDYSLLAGMALMLLHPFSAAIYTLTIFALGTESFFADRDRFASQRTPLVILGSSMLATTGFYFVLLPKLSPGAAFLLQVYRNTKFSINTPVLLLFVGPSLAVLIATFLLRDRKQISGAKFEGPMAFTAVAALLVSIEAFSFVTGKFLPQPTHWLRVYPIAFFLLAAMGIAVRESAAKNRACQGALLLAFAICLGDSILGTKASVAELVSAARAPALLNNEVAAITDALKQRPASRLIYFRECENTKDFPSFEYTLASLTPHFIGYGHAYFTKDLLKASFDTIICASDKTRKARWLSRMQDAKPDELILVDSALMEKLDEKERPSTNIFVRRPLFGRAGTGAKDN
jgi:hypothetical protein